MALVTTLLTVMAMLGGITLLLWLSTFIEARHLGPLVVDQTVGPMVEPAGPPTLTVVEAVQTAA